MLGEARITSGDYFGAEEELERALELNPRLPTLNATYGKLLRIMTRHDEANEAFLRDRCHQAAVAGVHRTEDQAARSLGDRALGDVEEPVVERVRPVEPECMVEARHLVAIARQARWPEHRREQAAVARVDEDRGVEVRVLRKIASRPHPQHALCGPVVARRVLGGAHLDRDENARTKLAFTTNTSSQHDEKCRGTKEIWLRQR